MARVRGVLAALVMSSAAMALPAEAQSRGSASLIHTVSVTVPSRVKVRVASLAVASLAVSTPAPSSNSSVRSNAEGLSLTVSASQPWVVAIGSRPGIATQKSQLQRSADGPSRFSVLTSALNGYPRGEPVMLTLTAP